MPFVIRRATLQDIPAISAAFAASWKWAYRGLIPQEYLDHLQNDHWVTALTEWIQSGSLSVAVATYNDTLCGAVIYGPSRNEHRPDWGEIVALYLLPEKTRQGLGQKLMQTALDELKQKHRHIFLWVLRENNRARTFYEQLGLQIGTEEHWQECSGVQLCNIRYIISRNEEVLP